MKKNWWSIEELSWRYIKGRCLILLNCLKGFYWDKYMTLLKYFYYRINKLQAIVTIFDYYIKILKKWSKVIYIYVTVWDDNKCFILLLKTLIIFVANFCFLSAKQY